MPRPAVVTRRHLQQTVDRSRSTRSTASTCSSAPIICPLSRASGLTIAACSTARPGAARRERRLFEYWAHEASLLPLELHPLLRWRMAAGRARRDRLEEPARLCPRAPPRGRGRPRPDPRRRPARRVRFRERQGARRLVGMGPRQARARMAVLGRHDHHRDARGSFERVYDLTERVIPAAILGLPTPSSCRCAARAGRARRPRARCRDAPATCATISGSIAGAHRRRASPNLSKRSVLFPVAVEGWRQPAFLHRDARRPRRIAGQALLAPFDPLIWERARTERLFGFRYRIEIYTPAHKRVHGYYVLPFLMDDASSPASTSRPTASAHAFSSGKLPWSRRPRATPMNG